MALSSYRNIAIRSRVRPASLPSSRLGPLRKRFLLGLLEVVLDDDAAAGAVDDAGFAVELVVGDDGRAHVGFEDDGDGVRVDAGGEPAVEEDAPVDGDTAALDEDHALGVAALGVDAVEVAVAEG